LISARDGGSESWAADAQQQCAWRRGQEVLAAALLCLAVCVCVLGALVKWNYYGTRSTPAQFAQKRKYSQEYKEARWLGV
jgi:hypothetical protein